MVIQHGMNILFIIEGDEAYKNFNLSRGDEKIITSENKFCN